MDREGGKHSREDMLISDEQRSIGSQSSQESGVCSVRTPGDTEEFVRGREGSWGHTGLQKDSRCALAQEPLSLPTREPPEPQGSRW